MKAGDGQIVSWHTVNGVIPLLSPLPLFPLFIHENLNFLAEQSDWNQVEDITPTPLTRADNISFEEHGVRMFHQNQPNTTLDVVAADQQFEMHKENMFNPLAYNTVRHKKFLSDSRPSYNNNITSTGCICIVLN